MKLWVFFLICLPLFAEREALTGDWNGLRDRAKEAGINISGWYGNDLLGNPAGGKHRGFANAGSFGIDLFLDLEKIGCFKEAGLFTSFVVRHGNNLSEEKIDNQFAVQQLFGRETYGLCELYLQKEGWEGKALGKIGRLAGGNDFFASPLYGNYVNNAFCGNPVSLFYNTLFTAYPNATWGAFLQLKPCSRLSIKLACYNNNRNVFKDKYHGVYFSFKSTQGVTLISEWQYFADAWGLPGNYKAGAYYITGRVPQFTGGTQRGNYGYYFLLDQMIYRKEAQELTPFIALLFATPSGRNKFPFFVTSGIIYKGLIPGRPADNLSLGAAYGSYSSYIEPKETYESILELNYWAWVNKWLVVIPNFQYVINPKGYGTIPNAYVMGLQILINL